MNGPAVWVVVAVFWLLPIMVARSIGHAKHRDSWLAYGIFLGWLGVLILALLPAAKDPGVGECPFCLEPVRFGAVVCPHCRHELGPSVAP